jgi:hypothetical protein
MAYSKGDFVTIKEPFTYNIMGGGPEVVIEPGFLGMVKDVHAWMTNPDMTSTVVVFKLPFAKEGVYLLVEHNFRPEELTLVEAP